MAEVFLCQTGQLTPASRRELKKAGIVVVEVDDPAACKFIRAGEVVSGDDLLWAALEAMRHEQYGSGGKGGWQRERFAVNVSSIVMAAHERQAKP